VTPKDLGRVSGMWCTCHFKSAFFADYFVHEMIVLIAARRTLALKRFCWPPIVMCASYMIPAHLRRFRVIKSIYSVNLGRTGGLHENVIYKLFKYFVVVCRCSHRDTLSGLLCDTSFGIGLFGHFGRFQGAQLELCHIARPATRFIVGSNNSSHTVKIPFACNQPVGQYVEGVHQNPLICIRP
jgi:hypothetical protein